MMTTVATSQNWKFKKKTLVLSTAFWGGEGAASIFAFSWPEQYDLEFSTHTKDFCEKKAPDSPDF
jgi:hypothetical protein